MNNKNLLAKTILIVAVLIVFLFGIFGHSQELYGPPVCWLRMQKRIHLGLDLKGGTHLILQVQVNDAINADTDRAVERLKDALKTANINLRRDHQAESAADIPRSSRSRVCRRSPPAICARW